MKDYCITDQNDHVIILTWHVMTDVLSMWTKETSRLHIRNKTLRDLQTRSIQTWIHQRGRTVVSENQNTQLPAWEQKWDPSSSSPPSENRMKKLVTCEMYFFHSGSSSLMSNSFQPWYVLLRSTSSWVRPRCGSAWKHPGDTMTVALKLHPQKTPEQEDPSEQKNTMDRWSTWADTCSPVEGEQVSTLHFWSMELKFVEWVRWSYY